MTRSPPATRYVRIWDLPTRCVHWLLVALLCGAYWSAEERNMEMHRYLGYSILGLTIFRIYWGFFGGSTALFARLRISPKEMISYSKTLLLRDSPRIAGHNPIGALGVIALLLLLIIQLVAGLFSVDVDGLESGPLSLYIDFETGRVAAKIHEANFEIMLVMIALHVAAVAFYVIYKRHNLIWSMFNGKAHLPEVTAQPPENVPVWRLIIGIAIAAAFVFATSRAFQI